MNKIEKLKKKTNTTSLSLSLLSFSLSLSFYTLSSSGNAKDAFLSGFMTMRLPEGASTSGGRGSNEVDGVEGEGEGDGGENAATAGERVDASASALSLAPAASLLRETTIIAEATRNIRKTEAVSVATTTVVRAGQRESCGGEEVEEDDDGDASVAGVFAAGKSALPLVLVFGLLA